MPSSPICGYRFSSAARSSSSNVTPHRFRVALVCRNRASSSPAIQSTPVSRKSGCRVAAKNSFHCASERCDHRVYSSSAPYPIRMMRDSPPAHSRASSGGESRIIRMGYGADELYTRWSQRSLAQWKEFFAATRQPLFLETGVLWMAGDEDARLRQTSATLKRCGVTVEELDRAALEKRYPQIGLDGIKRGIFEPESGVLMARRAVGAVVEDAVRLGADYRCAQVLRPTGSGRMHEVATSDGEKIAAGQFVFACGPWLGKIFPEVLGERIFPSPQEGVFFGNPAGDKPFSPPALPPVPFSGELVYGMPEDRKSVVE